MLKPIKGLIFGSIVLMSAFAGAVEVNGNPLIVPESDSPLKVYPRIHFVEGADLKLFNETYSRTLHEQRQEMVTQASELMFMGAGGEEAAKMLEAFDKHILNLRNAGKNRMGVTLGNAFKASLDELYEYYNPIKVRMQFVENIPVNQNDFIFYGTYSVRPNGRPGLIATLTAVNLKNGRSETFISENDVVKAAQELAGKLFYRFQRTRFPSKIKLGRNQPQLTLLERNRIFVPAGSNARAMYLKASMACQIRDGRLATENELVALSTLGDYSGGVTIGENSVSSYYWAVGDYGLVYHTQWSKAVDAANLNPIEYMNYVCIR